MLLLSVFGGVLADRIPRKRILQVGHVLNGGFAFLIGTLLLLDLLTVQQLFLIALLQGTVLALTISAGQAIVPEVAGQGAADERRLAERRGHELHAAAGPCRRRLDHRADRDGLGLPHDRGLLRPRADRPRAGAGPPARRDAAARRGPGGARRRRPGRTQRPDGGAPLLDLEQDHLLGADPELRHRDPRDAVHGAAPRLRRRRLRGRPQRARLAGGGEWRRLAVRDARDRLAAGAGAGRAAARQLRSASASRSPSSQQPQTSSSASG